ncbi:MAG: 50S ribosomal protein L18 [Candidatus Diapherotrites archaeon]|nr:50S ribosomal protein L18 [Candidatus Diapherotrites archaeon]
MKASCTYTVPFRRRKEQKTNYKKRLAAVKSGKPRLVVRGSNKSFIAEIIVYKPEGDNVICYTHSNELKKFGWKHHNGNIPAAYLTGFLCAKKGMQKKIEEAILDIGLTTPVHGSRVFSALKGAIDAGIKINAEEVYPKEERIKGKHCSADLEKDFETVKKQIQEKTGTVKSNE